MITNELLAIYAGPGAAAYFGEAVTVTQHSLQAAYFAQRSDAPDDLIVAALLHDIGHLIEPAPADIADWKTDARHEWVGSQWLALRFGADVCEPVRLHVPAKRYLCATDAGYYAALSAASKRSLAVQGGAFDTAEAEDFAALPFAQDAVALRRWDDRAKVPHAPTRSLEAYRDMIRRVAEANPPA